MTSFKPGRDGRQPHLFTSDVIRSPVYATAVGLALQGLRARPQGVAAQTVDGGNPLARLARGLTGILNDIL